MSKARGYAAQSATTPLGPFSFERREPIATDVQIEILYCGVCHSDLHTARNEWTNTIYPVVPGHEIVGRVTAVGSQVKKFKVGDVAAVGCMVDSDRTCPNCRAGNEQYCDTGMIGTYNSPDQHMPGAMTYGGYSSQIVVDQDFVLQVPKHLDLKAVAPLLCAGITTYSPLRHWKVGPGQKVAILGLGGLGHMAVKFAASFGAEVTMLSTSPAKEADAKRLGAHKFVLTSDKQSVKSVRGYFNYIIDTVSAPHDYN